MPTYHDLLDAGDRLADALTAGDLAHAEAVLHEREALIAAVGAGLGPPPAALVERARRQDAHLRGVLDDGLRALASKRAEASRTATATVAYARPTPPARLDTGRQVIVSSQIGG